MKKISISILLIITTCVMATLSLAAAKTTATITAPNEATRGSTITVEIPVSGSGDGVNGLQGTLNYDKDVLELTDGINTNVDGWFISGYNENTGIFLAEVRSITARDTFVTDEKKLVTIEFKVKEDAKIGETEVDVSNIVASGTTDLEVTDISKKINIVGASNPGNNNVTNNTTTNNTVTNTNNTTNNNSVNSTNTNKTNTNTNKANNNTSGNDTANKIIPKTGIENTVSSFMVILSVAAFVFYIKCRKYEDVD